MIYSQYNHETKNIELCNSEITEEQICEMDMSNAIQLVLQLHAYIKTYGKVTVFN